MEPSVRPKRVDPLQLGPAFSGGGESDDEIIESTDGRWRAVAVDDDGERGLADARVGSRDT